MEKKCKKCNQLKTINEFSGKNQICNFCKDKRKNRLKLCKKCNQLKIKESEFNYGMKICNECQSKRRQVVKSIKKRMNVCHCRYCNSETNNKGRICDYCRNTIKCKRCKKRLSKDKFTNSLVCNDCLNIAIKNKQIARDNRKQRHIICIKCNKEVIVIKRYNLNILKDLYATNALKLKIIKLQAIKLNVLSVKEKLNLWLHRI
jgi:hypothetical protein